MKERREAKELEEERLYVASQWQLIWRKFRKHRLAAFSMVVLGVFYFLAAFCEFLSPYNPDRQFLGHIYAPFQRIHFFDQSKRFQLLPFVYGLTYERDPITLAKIATVDETRKYNIHFFISGDRYKLWNLFESNLHFIGAKDAPIFLFGADNLGRDLLSRILYATRISLSIGLVGVFLTFVFGVILGGISGYFGGVIDSIIMRTVDLLISIPTIPLWMALAAALPRNWPPTKLYFAITIIFSIINWTGLARVVRGKLIATREEDFVTAAKLSGVRERSIIIRHLLPSCASYIIVSITLSVPRMILGETALSFIGLGLQPPVVSWGVLLQNAQKVQNVANHPWLLIPCLFVILSVLMFNFLGDGFRDAVDPYK